MPETKINSTERSASSQRPTRISKGDFADKLNITNNEVHDYTRGPKPILPTRPGIVIDYVDLSISNFNATTLEPNKDILTQLSGIIAFQENQTPLVKHRAIAKQWKLASKFIQLGPPSITKGHALAGVGFQHAHTTLTADVGIQAETFQRIHDQGRVKHTGVVIRKYVSFIICNAYGHAGGHHEATAAINTSRISGAMLEENKAQGNGPAIICTDHNAETDDTNAVVTKLLGAEIWIVAGARASPWGGVNNAPICNANGSKAGARRDYICAHPALIGYINRVNVHDDATFATHARVELISLFNGNKFRTRTAGKITPLHDMNPQDDDGKNWRPTVGSAIESKLQQAEHNLATLHREGNVEAGSWRKVSSLQPGLTKKGRPYRGEEDHRRSNGSSINLSYPRSLHGPLPAERKRPKDSRPSGT